MNYNRNMFPFIAGGILILAFTTILRPFAVIDTGERGVVMYFGKVQKQILDEGIHPVIPIVTKIKPINVRVQTTEVKAKGSSKDLQDVETTIIVNWHIDPDKVNQIYQQVGDINEIVSGIINPAVSEIVKAATAQRPVQNILQERGELKREIETSLAERLRRYGIIINDVSLVNFGFSEEFNAAIEAKQVAEQKAQEAAFRAQQAAQEAMGSFLQSAWQDIHEIRTFGLAGKDAHKQQKREDFHSARLLSQKEEEELRRGRSGGLPNCQQSWNHGNGK
jgi:regulator of protease activity HflC (stomatin/prohibitin superfamily)